jgi:hypothetical protein
MDYEIGYGKPPRDTRFKEGEASANPRGRPRKNPAASLVEGLNKMVVVTENGRPRKIAVREAITSQLINKPATADLRAIKMLLNLIKDAETRAAAATAPEPSPRFTAAVEEVVEQLIVRLRRQILTEMAANATSQEQGRATPAPSEARVLLFDEHSGGTEKWSWLYTGITCASVPSAMVSMTSRYFSP